MYDADDLSVNWNFGERIPGQRYVADEYIPPLPSQYTDTLRSSGRTPEQRLMAAVLEDAIEILVRGRATCAVPGQHSKQVRDAQQLKMVVEAAAWLDGAPAGISYEMCCEALGIDAEWLRRGILAASTKPNSIRCDSSLPF